MRALDSAGNDSGWSSLLRYVNVGRSDQDFNGDGYSDVVVGAPKHDPSGMSDAGRAYIFFGAASMDNGPDKTFSGLAAGDLFGCGVASAGDVNADGYCDAIIGACGRDVAGKTDAGTAYIYYGGALMNTAVDVTLVGADADDAFGTSVASAGDLNADGYSDVVVGAPDSDGASMTDSGMAIIYFGGSAMDSTADAKVVGEAASDNLGSSVASAGDMNGDGYCDVIVGAPGNNANGGGSGEAYIFFGGAVLDVTPDATWAGPSSMDIFGASGSSAGDSHGDGYCDALVGAPGVMVIMGKLGKAYVYNGGASLGTEANVTMSGAGEALFGCSVSAAGDVNGDGFCDVIIGAENRNFGEAYLFYGGSPMNNGTDATIAGEAAGDLLGCSVSSAGDVNGDGFSDVIVGAKGNDAGGNAGSGEVYIFYGGSPMNTSPDVTLAGEASGDAFGSCVE